MNDVNIYDVNEIFAVIANVNRRRGQDCVVERPPVIC